MKYQIILSVDTDHDLDSFAIDVDNGSSKSTVTAVGGAEPFGTIEAGDVLTLSNCTDSDNDGTYTVDSATATVITFTATMGGEDTGGDVNAVITLAQSITDKRPA